MKLLQSMNEEGLIFISYEGESIFHSSSNNKDRIDSISYQCQIQLISVPRYLIPCLSKANEGTI